MTTGIQWTDETWNPTVGCTRVSAGCDHCYAFQVHDQRHVAWKRGRWDAAPSQYHQPFSRVQLMPERLTKPLHWKKPRKVFVNSMSDLFHEDVPDEFIAEVYAPMIAAYWHIYQVLTKRPDRRRKLFGNREWRQLVAHHAANIINGLRGRDDGPEQMTRSHRATMNLAQWNAGAVPNIWEGTSVEDQAAADERIPHLLATPAAVRFLSCEPLLGELRLWPWTQPVGTYGTYTDEKGVHFAGPHIDGQSPIDWVIVGGESGPHARSCDVEWIRSIVGQCQASGVAVFVKQLGSDPLFDRDELPVGARSYEADGGMTSRLFAVKLRSGHGSDPAEWPEDLRIRQFPGDLTSPDARSGPKQG